MKANTITLTEGQVVDPDAHYDTEQVSAVVKRDTEENLSSAGNLVGEFSIDKLKLFIHIGVLSLGNNNAKGVKAKAVKALKTTLEALKSVK